MTNDAQSAEDAQLVLGDGRRLGYAQYGQPDGEPIMYFHGHPGSRLEARLVHEAAAAAGFRVIALDRPGYGLSDFRPGRAITDWPADVAQAADALGIGRFSVAGASGGGPYVLACAREFPDRVVRAAVISGVGPFHVAGSTAGMRWQNRVGFRLCARFPALARILMRSMHRNISSRPERTIEALARAMSPVDAEIVGRPEVRTLLITDITEAFRAAVTARHPTWCCSAGRGGSPCTRSSKRSTSGRARPTPSYRPRWAGTKPSSFRAATPRCFPARATC